MKQKTRQRHFATRAVHEGEREPRSRYTPVVSPIHPSVSYLYDSLDELDAVLGAQQPGYVYHRFGNPTVAALEQAVASLEGTEAAIACASGMAAVHAALLAAGVRAGSALLVAVDLYGASYTLAVKLMAQLDVRVEAVDITDLAQVERSLDALKPAALLVETISNPLLKIADLQALASMAHSAGASLLVDNTFASPWLCNPLTYGADIVIHSATKYIGGHGDVMAGLVACSAELRHNLYELNKLVGGVLGPFEAWLALRGLKTLPLRMRQHCDNALAIAGWLSKHPRVSRVNYPGLETHPQHALARFQFGGRGYGGVLSFEIAGVDRPAVFRFMERLDLVLPATSLGDIYSLVLHPATSSHRSLRPTERAKAGIQDNLVRLSAGIEDPSDIIADLEQALDRAG